MLFSGTFHLWHVDIHSHVGAGKPGTWLAETPGVKHGQCN